MSGTSARTGALDGLRGLAALMVVLSHASAGGLYLLPGLHLEGMGKPGVFLFFVLSAYLLTRQALRWPRDARWGRHLAGYALRRVARILPLYLLVLLAAWALGGNGLGVPIDGTAVLRHLTLQEGRGIYWSIPVEFLYYLWIPPLALLLSTPLRWLAPLILVAVMLLFPGATAPANSDALRWYLPVLLCGSFAACVKLPASTARGSRWSADALLSALLIGSAPLLFGLPVDQWHREFLAWGLLWSLVLLTAASRRFGLWQALFESRLLGLMGRCCFGLYLLHLPVIAVARRLPLPTTLQAWLVPVLALLLAWLAHRSIERPAMQWVASRAARIERKTA